MDFSTYINVYQTDYAIDNAIKMVQNIPDGYFLPNCSEMLQNGLLSPMSITNVQRGRNVSERPYNENSNVSFNLHLSIEDFIDNTLKAMERAEKARACSASSETFWEDEEGDGITW